MSTAKSPVPEPAPEAGDAEAHAVAAVMDVFSTWLKTQNDGDPAGYLRLYETERFVGLKRTHRGKRSRFGFQGWSADRRGMFRNRFEVVADDVSFETWLSEGSDLGPRLSRVRFVQRWRSDKYADHGPKTLLFWHDPRDGTPRIVFEEMLLSRRGFRAVPPQVREFMQPLQDLTEPAAIQQALAELKVTGKNVAAVGEALAELPNAGAIAVPLIALGDVRCIAQIAYEECGEVSLDWGAVETAEGLGQPCNRRGLLLPLLRSGRLTATQLDALYPAIAPALKQAPADTKLLAALVEALTPMPLSLRKRYAEAALGPEESAAEAAALMALVPGDSALDLARTARRAEPVLHVDAVAHRRALLSLHREHVPLPKARLLDLVAAFVDKRERELLKLLVEDDDCEIAMAAADGLDDLGDASGLPRWEHIHDEAQAQRALCMLQHDSDTSRQSDTLKRFFHPDHPHTTVDVVDTDTDFGSMRDELLRQSAELSAEQRRINREAEQLLGLSSRPALRQASIRRSSTPDLPAMLRVSHFGAAPSGPHESFTTVNFTVHRGRVYVDGFVSVSVENWSCPC